MSKALVLERIFKPTPKNSTTYQETSFGDNSHSVADATAMSNGMSRLLLCLE